LARGCFGLIKIDSLLIDSLDDCSARTSAVVV
jgi:hypothetical protein